MEHQHAAARCAHHGPREYDRAFALAIGLNLAFVGVEAVCGILGQSLALVADAGHNLSDVLGLVVAWVASWLCRRGPSAQRTYGLGRSSILASLFNSLLLLLVAGAIALEAAQRFREPRPVATGLVLLVAAIGIGINTATAVLFLRGRKTDLNIRGAFLHMAADAAVSVGVLVSALVIRATSWQWVDPALSLGIVLVIVAGTWRLFRESLDLALDAIPRGIDRAAVERFLAEAPGVAAVHDLHIWGLSTTRIALTAHLVKPDAGPDDDFLAELSAALHERFGIGHVTIQVERCPDNSCTLAPADVI
jgi:cobalt-zinc-cadmium efflux system protein